MQHRQPHRIKRRLLNATTTVHNLFLSVRCKIAHIALMLPLYCNKVFSATCALVLLHLTLVAIVSCTDSPTLNEPAHLSAGIRYWQSGDFSLYKVDPPLPRLLAAIPVLIAGANYDWRRLSPDPETRTECQVGEDFIAANGERSVWLMTLARWSCLPFTLLGAGICFRWSSELYGLSAGLLSLTLWCFCPNIIGHAHLITCDVAATSLGLLANYSFWHWLQKPDWRGTLKCGILLGFAELAKTTLLILFLLWPLLWVIYQLLPNRNLRSKSLKLQALMLPIQFAVAILVINAGYGFENTFTPIRQLRFFSNFLSGNNNDTERPAEGNRFANSCFGVAPLPLPANYVLGIDLQKRDFESFTEPSYLNGEFRASGWWYYYLVALTLKVPLGTWILAVLAISKSLWNNSNWSMRRSAHNSSDQQLPSVNRNAHTLRFKNEVVLLAPPIAILALVSSQTGLSEHFRYLLPAFPYVFVWLGRIVPFLGRQHRIITAVAAISITWGVSSSLSVYPHSISYFNELAGGPIGGPTHLIHSNVDWGQDLFFLKAWLQSHPNARPLKLAYFGYFDPKFAGIEYSAPTCIPTPSEVQSGRKIPPGWYAISVNFVRGIPYFCYEGNGAKTHFRQNELAAFQMLPHVATAGYSIYIYHVLPDSP